MIETLRSFGKYSLGVVFLIAMFALPFLFFKGAVWASTNLLRPLILIGFLVVIVDIVILLPLSMFRRLRPHTGGLIYLTSYLFGLVTWLYGFIITYALIALAQIRDGVVVSQETSAAEKRKPPEDHYIPDVCRELGVPRINLLGLMRRERWEL